jgi:tRNA U34 5-carboxymethylaminomethyl modifying GTPase MnmE/TrmE
MFNSLRSKFKTRGSVLADGTPFEPVQFSATEPAQASSSEPVKSLTAEEEDRARRIRALCSRFRILIIGRANAGKTTVLQKVCNTTEKPVIYNSKGTMVRNANEKLNSS